MLQSAVIGFIPAVILVANFLIMFWFSKGLLTDLHKWISTIISRKNLDDILSKLALQLGLITTLKFRDV